MFLIIIPTIRDPKLTRGAIARAYETRTWATDLFVLDGKQGKSATLNYARRFYDVDRYRYLVTLDDDLYLPPEWQRDCVSALEIGGLAAVGLDLSDTEEGRTYMSEVNEREEHATDFSLRIRPLHKINIAGAFICMRMEDAFAIGAYPWDQKTHYEVDEDGWRCRQIRNRGGKLGYVETRCGKPLMLNYADSEEYLEMKKADIDYIRNVKGK